MERSFRPYLVCLYVFGLFFSASLAAGQPTITQQPVDIAACPAQTVTFTVSATSQSGTMQFSWFEGATLRYTETALSPHTSAYVALAGDVSPRMWCRITDQDGAVSSNSAVVLPPPTSDVSSVAAYYLGYCYALTVAVSEDRLPYATYAWYRGIPGDTSTLIGQNSAVMVCPTETTEYWLKVNDVGTCGAVRVATVIP